MPEIRINNKVFLTQTGAAEPVLASNVDMGSATFPAGHVLQIRSEWFNGTVSNNGIDPNWNHVLSQSLTFINDNPLIYIWASTGESDWQSGRVHVEVCYSSSPLDDTTVDTAVQFGGYPNCLVSGEVGRSITTGTSGGVEAHYPNSSYFASSLLTGLTAGSTYYFGLRLAVRTTGWARIGNGNKPQIVIMEIAK